TQSSGSLNPSRSRVLIRNEQPYSGSSPRSLRGQLAHTTDPICVEPLSTGYQTSVSGGVESSLACQLINEDGSHSTRHMYSVVGVQLRFGGRRRRAVALDGRVVSATGCASATVR